MATALAAESAASGAVAMATRSARGEGRSNSDLETFVVDSKKKKKKNLSVAAREVTYCI